MKMIRGIGWIVAISFILGLRYSAAPAFAEGGSQKINLTPAWTWGIISDDFGENGIVVEDLTQDGQAEIVACTDSAFALRYDQSGGYAVIWYSEHIDCRGIAAGDRDEDGVSEIYALSGTGEIIVYDGSHFIEIGRFNIPGGGAQDLILEDVDDDGDLEIAVAVVTPFGQSNRTQIYDAQTFELEWDVNDHGGLSIDAGDIDGDGEIEIVVNYPNEQASVLDAKTQSVEWVYDGGFGWGFSLGDVDNDLIDEIAFIESWDFAYVFEADTQTMKWSLDDLSDVSEVLVADLDGDGAAEVIIGNGQWGAVTGYRGSDGAYLWAVENPEHGVFGLAAGDPDDDDINEIVFGAGLSSGAKDIMAVADWTTESLEYVSPDLDGRLSVTAADVDLDGEIEIVMASNQTDSGYDGSTLQVFDAATKAVEWSKIAGGSIYEVYTGQLDGDPALEILSAAGFGGLIVTDGITQAQEWLNLDAGEGKLAGVVIENLDEDPVEEILVAYGGSGGRVTVFNGASDEIQWQSEPVGYILDLSIGDTDGDGVRELAVLKSSELIVYDLSTWTVDFTAPVTDAARIASLSYGPGISGRFIVYAEGFYSSDPDQLRVYHGATGSEIQAIELPVLDIHNFFAEDLDSDGDLEIALLGLYDDDEKSYMEIYSSPNPFTFVKEYSETGSWGSINSLAFENLDGDADPEIVLGAENLIQVREISAAPMSFSLAFMPALRSCHLLYHDDFSNPGSGWPVVNTGNTVYKYWSGEYRILLVNPYGLAGAYPGPSFTSYLVSTDVRNVFNREGTYGLLFAHETGWTSFYTFEIDRDQHYEIWLYDSGWTKIREGTSPFLEPGAATNRIGIVRNGSVIDAYANGVLIDSITSAPLTGSLHVGVWVTGGSEGNLDIRYDNYKVEPLGCGWSEGLASAEPGGTPFEADFYDPPGWIQQVLPPRDG